MSECQNIELKYLTEQSNGIRLYINRGMKKHKELFLYRKHGGKDKTLAAARSKRDLVHMDLFGQPISKNFTHILKKKNSLNPELPPGISLGYSREKLLYVVVNYTQNKKPTRKRYNIESLTYKEALKRAIEFKKNL